MAQSALILCGVLAFLTIMRGRARIKDAQGKLLEIKEGGVYVKKT